MNWLYRRYIKRWIDFVAALAALIVLSPLMLIISLCVRIDVGTPVMFRQQRIGLNEREFTMYKFRTMREETDEWGRMLPDEERVTKIGAFLRSSGLDELPELFNILRGDLSIVGPRPLLVEYLPYYTQEERLRHTVRGGLTQPEVLYGKALPTWDEQLGYEVEYAKNLSFFMDVRIILKTVKILFVRVNDHYGETSRKTLIEERASKVVR